jgi:hypothetical protein
MCTKYCCYCKTEKESEFKGCRTKHHGTWWICKDCYEHEYPFNPVISFEHVELDDKGNRTGNRFQEIDKIVGIY